MKKLIFNTETKKLLSYPRSDGALVVGLADHLVPVVETILDDEFYDPETQFLEVRRVVDREAGTVTVQRVAVNMSPEQLAAARAVQFPPAEAVDVRDWLLDQGITALMVEAQIVQLYPDLTEQARALNRWHHATKIPRDHPLVVSIGAALGFTPDQLDEQWSSILSR